MLITDNQFFKEVHLKYIVKETHIRHGNATYGPGDVIELAEEEAASITHHLEPVAEAEKSSDDDDGKKRRRR